MDRRSISQESAPFQSFSRDKGKGPKDDTKTLVVQLLEAIRGTGPLQSNNSPTTGSKFRTPVMKAPERFDGENPTKLRPYLQSCKLLFTKDPGMFTNDRQKVIYASSYLGGRAAQWFQPYLDSLDNKRCGKPFLVNSYNNNNKSQRNHSYNNSQTYKTSNQVHNK